MCLYKTGWSLFSDVPVGGDYSQAITFLSDIQVIAGKPDGSFGVNDAITRADAACLIARMMTGQMNPPKYDKHVAFTDVEVGSYYESAVGYCAALGITSGTGNGQFSPKRTITDGEFVAMLTRALGYDTAENPLSYPMGNIVVAQAKGLLDGVNIDYMSDALRGEDAQMLYNAVFADYDRAAKNKNVYQAADDHYTITIAEEVFDLGRLSHDTDLRPDDSFPMGFHGANKNTINNCDVHTWVIAGVDARYKENTYIAFAVDDDDEKAISPEDKAWAYQEFTYTGDIKPLLGYRVELWGEMDHSNAPWEVAAIKVLDGQSAYDYNAGMYTDEKKVKVEDKTLYIDDNHNQVNLANINLDKNTAARLNWATETQEVTAPYVNTFAKDGAPYTKYTDAYTLATVDAKLLRNSDDNKLIHLNFADGDQYKLIDWDSDDYIDFVVRETYKYGEVTSVSKSRIVLEVDDAKNQTRGSYALKLDDDNLVVTGADGLEEGDIVEISVVSRVYTRSDDEVVTINLTALDSESKTLEKINMTKDTYTFDGEELTFADRDLFDLVEEDDSREEMRTVENVGQAFNIYFDRSGFMLKGNVADDSARGYLMILSTANGNAKLYNTVVRGEKRDLPIADVLFDDNTVGEEVVFVKDLKIDGKNDGSNGYNKSNRSWNQKQVIGNVYKYYMNEDNEITRLEEQTIEQRTNYAFDDSKDRISIRNNNNLNTYTTYSFSDDAAIFAAKVNTTNGTGTANTLDQGYIRVAANGDFYVDPDDVVAVKPEDVPEIDNRETTVPSWYDNEVTHPAVFLTEKAVQDFKDDKTADGVSITNDPQGPFAGPTANADYWMKNDLVEASIWNAKGRTTYNGTIDDAKNLPAIAYNYNSKKDEIVAAVMGVDTLDYFNQSSVKLALITDVYARNSKTYSVHAAIDGEVSEFVTVSGDEEDIFKGRVGELAIDSLADMQSYLNLNKGSNVDDPYEGARHGLYAEVKMNSDGAITEIRAMDILPINATSWASKYSVSGVSSTNDDATQIAVGNVYYVVRGVVTQINSNSKNTQVTWQTNPVAASKTRLYTLSETDDFNGWDTLESYYDNDTFFYEVEDLPILTPDKRVTIATPFDEELSDGLNKATESVLDKSLFIDADPGDAVYYLADFAVRKSDTDSLVAVFAFTDDLSNETANTKGEISAADIVVENNDRVDGSTPAVPASTTIKVLSSTGVGGSFDINVNNGTAVSLTLTAGAAGDTLAAANQIGLALKNNFTDVASYTAQSNADGSADIILTAADSATVTELDVDIDQNASVVIGDITKEARVPGSTDSAAARSAYTTITVKPGLYRVNSVAKYTVNIDSTKSTDIDNSSNGVDADFFVGKTYSASEIAAKIADGLTSVCVPGTEGLKISVNGNVVTIRDAADICSVGQDLDVSHTVTP